MDIIKKIDQILCERTIVNSGDVERLLVVVKQYGKIGYDGREYGTAKVSDSKKSINAIAFGGKTINIPISNIKEYEIKNNVVMLK